MNLFNTVKKSITDGKSGVYAPEIPNDVTSFLGNLGMFYGVPPHYFIPNENYLPEIEADENNPEKGALKLFWLDKDWIECLIDGALSFLPENDADRKYLLQMAMQGNYVAWAFFDKMKTQIRNQMLGSYSAQEFETEFWRRIKAKNILFEKDQESDKIRIHPTNAQSSWRYTGFFMRSSLISSWVGIEILAKGKDANEDAEAIRPLQVIRLERLAEDTLFCICEGIIQEIDITEPAESVHFEIKRTESEEKAIINDLNVLDISALKKLSPFTNAAEFAEKLIAKPLTLKLQVSWSSK